MSGYTNFTYFKCTSNDKTQMFSLFFLFLYFRIFYGRCITNKYRANTPPTRSFIFLEISLSSRVETELFKKIGTHKDSTTLVRPYPPKIDACYLRNAHKIRILHCHTRSIRSWKT